MTKYWLGKKIPDEMKKKISDTLKKNQANYPKRKPHSEEAKKKIGLTGLGRIPWNKGHKGRRPWHNISGLNNGGPWNKGKKGLYSSETIAKIKKSRSIQGPLPKGEDHWNWKGGVTILRKKLQETSLYRNWRSLCYQRDDFTCQKCKKRGGKLHVDHIKAYSLIVSENKIITVEEAKRCSELWDILNGRTLCMSCHQKTDNYGSKSITNPTLSSWSRGM